MNFTPQIPYIIGAIVVWFLAGSVAHALTGNANTAMLVACISAFIVWMIGRDKMKDYEAVLEDPPTRLFDVSDFEVLAAVKEVMHNNIEDKWWSAKLVDDSPDEDGNMKSKYVMKYEEELKTPKPKTLTRQLILDIKIAKVSTKTSVKLNYQVASDVHRHVANGILENTTAMIWTRLEKLEAARARSSEAL